MVIAERLRFLREQKNLSQGDIENRTGLLRCYISRVENAHTVPSIDTLEKLSRALEVPLYQIFYEGEEPAKPPRLLKRNMGNDIAWGTSGREAIMLDKFRRLLSRTSEENLKILLFTAQKMAQTRRRKE